MQTTEARALAISALLTLGIDGSVETTKLWERRGVLTCASGSTWMRVPVYSYSFNTCRV